MQYKFLLVDATGLLVRCEHAGRGAAMQPDAGAAFMFISALTRHLRQEKPTHAILCWDGLYATRWRQRIWSGYKRSRHVSSVAWNSRELVTRFSSAAGVSACSSMDYEADDAIAACWRTIQGEHPDASIVIVSDDADLHQLLESGVEQIPLTGTGGTWDITRVREHYGCEPGNLPLLRALSGDSSDGIPGFPGIGPKRALKLLEAGEWQLGKTASKVPFDDGDPAAQAEIYRQLLDLRRPPRALDKEPAWSSTDLGLVSAWKPPAAGSPEIARVRGFLEALGMSTILAKLEADQLW